MTPMNVVALTAENLTSLSKVGVYVCRRIGVDWITPLCVTYCADSVPLVVNTGHALFRVVCLYNVLYPEVLASLCTSLTQIPILVLS